MALLSLYILALTTTLCAQPGAPPAVQASQPASPVIEELWAAARAGDSARVRAALEKGADVNAKTRYGATALTFAADKGHADVVTLLLERGADVNAQDSFYQMRAIDLAMANAHHAVVRLLLDRGSRGAPAVLAQAIQRGEVPLVSRALESPEMTRANLRQALAGARKANNAEIIALIEKKIASLPEVAAAPAVPVDRAVLESYVGTYRNDAGGTLAVTLSGDHLVGTPSGAPPSTLVAISQTVFRVSDYDGMTLTFEGRGGLIESALLQEGTRSQRWTRVAAPAEGSPSTPAAGAPAPAASGAAAPSPVRAAARTAGRNWPGFRGSNADGNGDGQGAPTEWDVDTGQNIRWKTAVPGIATASPIVWGDRVFVVSAVSSAGDKTFRTGLYGDVAPVNDLSEHTWKIFALDKGTGKILWERDAYKGVPKVKRHTKSTQANSTPATDGRRVVAVFGSIGRMFAWDVNGKPLWETELGVLDSGWFFDPDYQWGHSSSPIIHDAKVIVQADRQKDSFIAAYDVATGKQIWRTSRDEISSWGTPTVFRSAAGAPQVVTNGPRIRGYDLATGKLLWTLGPNSEVTVGTPVVGDGLVYVTGGYPPARPIYAIRPTASGEITLPKDGAAHDAVAWRNSEGTYIPTPLVYGGILYTFANGGAIRAYDAATGQRIYNARVGAGGAFSASPVAADGRLYFASEDGDIFVARAGGTYEEIARNEMKEVIMATPAISDGVIIVRTLGHVYGIGEKPQGAGPAR